MKTSRMNILLAFAAVAFAFDAKTGERQAHVTLKSEDVMPSGISGALGLGDAASAYTLTILTDEVTANEMQRKGTYEISLYSVEQKEIAEEEIVEELTKVVNSVVLNSDLSIGKGNPALVKNPGHTDPDVAAAVEKVKAIGNLKIGS